MFLLWVYAIPNSERLKLEDTTNNVKCNINFFGSCEIDACDLEFVSLKLEDTDNNIKCNINFLGPMKLMHVTLSS